MAKNWTTRFSDDKKKIYVCNGNEVIATIDNDDVDPKQALAAARLISVVPELLRKSKDLATVVKKYNGQDELSYDEDFDDEGDECTLEDLEASASSAMSLLNKAVKLYRRAIGED